MKNLILGMFLFAIIGAAQAGALVVANSSAVTFNGYDDTPKAVAGARGFSFADNAGTGQTFSNDQSRGKTIGFAILEEQTNQYGKFDNLLGFNDSYAGDADYMVGVKFVSAPVPEPEIYAMLLAGLGLIGFTARRRKQNT